MGMKENFGRIKLWIKKHPIAAVLIILGIAVLIFLIISGRKKNDSEEEQQASSPDKSNSPVEPTDNTLEPPTPLPGPSPVGIPPIGDVPGPIDSVGLPPILDELGMYDELPPFDFGGGGGLSDMGYQSVAEEIKEHALTGRDSPMASGRSGGASKETGRSRGTSTIAAGSGAATAKGGDNSNKATVFRNNGTNLPIPQTARNILGIPRQTEGGEVHKNSGRGGSSSFSSTTNKAAGKASPIKVSLPPVTVGKPNTTRPPVHHSAPPVIVKKSSSATKDKSRGR